MQMTHTADTKTKPYAVDRAISGSFDLDSTDGFSWAEARIVQIDNPPHEAAFDTDRFYKIDATLARPIRQTYQTYDGEVVMKKPADELRDAAWSADNAPVTLGHPSSQIVDSVDLVHGFVRQPHWDSDDEALQASVYIPVSDTRAKSWIEDNDGVSIGFWNEPEAPPEQIADDVDRIQTNLYVDHVAIVETGRCSREDGCGLAADAADARAIRGFAADTGAAGCSGGPCSCGIHVDEESYDQHKYDSRARAMDAAERMGCDDVHQHDDGTFMPCETDEEFEDRLEEQEVDAAEYSQGDWVRWDYSGGSAVGRVERSSTSETLEVEGGTREASEDNPAYRIQHWDDGEFGNAVVKRESELRSAEPPADFESDSLVQFHSDSEPSASMDELDEVYADWSDATNMTASELRRWSENPCSREASQNPGDVIRRNLRLLETNKEDWDTDDIRDAKRTISFVERMNSDENRPESPADGAHGCPTDWAISLLNWAHNPFDSLPDRPDDLDAVEEITVDGPSNYGPDRNETDFGYVTFDHQTGGGTSVTVEEAWAMAPYWVCIHVEGEEYEYQNANLSSSLGGVGPFDGGEHAERITVDLDEHLAETDEVYATLHYDDDGEKGPHILGEMGAIFDSAVVMVDEVRGSNFIRRHVRDGGLDVAQIHDRLFDGDGSYDPPTETMFDIDESRTVAGVTFQGVRDGKLDESEIPNDDYEEHYLYPADTKSESSYPVVDAEGYLRAGNVAAAHQLGARGGVDSDEHDEKIKRLNEVTCESDVGCVVDSLTEDSTTAGPSDEHTDSIMTNDTDASPLNVGDLTIDAIAAEHDAVAELREEKTELEDRVEVLTDKVDSLEEEVESYRADEKQDLVDEITSLTDAWAEDDLMEMDLDAVEEKLELARDIYEDVDAATVDTGADGDVAGSLGDNGNAGSSSQYEPGQVYDLADTA